MPTLQWQRLPAGGATWVNLSDDAVYTNTAQGYFTITATTLAMNGDQFRAVATNSNGSAASAPILLTVMQVFPPQVLLSADSRIITSGQLVLDYGLPLSLGGSASGPPEMTFQWSKDGVAIPGATSQLLYKEGMTPADNGQYTLTATDRAGPGSASVTVTVNPAVAALVYWQRSSYSLNYGESLQINPESIGGTLPQTYQWNKNGVPLPGATDYTYKVASATTADSGSYTLSVTNAAGTTVSTAVSVGVAAPVSPIIAGGPAQGSTETLAYGQDLYLQYQVYGTQPMTIAWTKDGGPPPVPASGGYYTKYGATPADSGQYTIVATNAFGSSNLTVTVVVNPPVPPAIANLPATLVLTIGDDLNLSALASGTFPMSFQWTKDGVVVPNASLASYSKTGAAAADSGQYTLTATNVAGTASASVAVTVNPPLPPTIAVQPASIRIGATQMATFDVFATGAGPMNYQWYFNGQAIAGGTGRSYTTYANSGSVGNYTVSVSNYLGSVLSDPAILSVKVYGVDFNGDGKADLFWTNAQTGERRIWLMSGSGYGSEVDLGVVSLDWIYAGVGDLFGDGGNDVIWRNKSTGEVRFWRFAGAMYVGSGSLGTLALEWSIVGVADFIHSGRSALLTQNTVTGELALQTLDYGNDLIADSLGFVPTEWSVSGVADFDRDGNADILWTNTKTGERLIWLMNATQHTTSATLGIIPLNLQISAVDDFNGDGWPDLLMTDTATNDRSIWLMNGATHVGTVSLGIIAPEWTTEGAPSRPIQLAKLDFNGDGQNDLLWENTNTGEHYVWLMNGTSLASSQFLGLVSAPWRLAASGDFNGDGQPDLVWENTSTGERYIWLMNGTAFVSSVYLGTISTDWRIAATGDFNGDAQADLVWENTSTGERYVWLMNGTAFVSSIYLGTIGTEWRIADTGDFNGDGQPDLVWENKSTGEHYVWLMNGTTFASAVSLGVISTDWSIAAVADYNGDGQPDLVWQNTVTGERYLWLMNGTSFASGSSLGTIPTQWRIVP